jgi:hypothetical protein
MKFHITRWSSALGLAVLFALLGCATPPPTTAMLTYETKPEGATLFEGGNNLGVAPVTRTYTGDGKSDSIRTPLVTAVWPSGAKESFYTFVPLGSDRVATIERPAGAPGLQADLDNGKKVADARAALAKRSTDNALRDARRDSERCRKQQSGASQALADDC